MSSIRRTRTNTENAEVPCVNGKSEDNIYTQTKYIKEVNLYRTLNITPVQKNYRNYGYMYNILKKIEMYFKKFIESQYHISFSPRLIYTFVVGRKQEHEGFSVTGTRNRFCQEEK